MGKLSYWKVIDITKVFFFFSSAERKIFIQELRVHNSGELLNRNCIEVLKFETN